MKNKEKIIKNSGIQIGSKLFSTILGLVALAIMTRALGTEQYGWYTTAASFMQFIGIFADFGFMLITGQMLAQAKFSQNKIINTLFTWRLITGILFYGGACAIIWAFPYNLNIKIAACILSLSFLFITLNQVLTGYYQFKLKMIIPSVGEVLSRVILVMGILFLSFQKIIFLPLMMMVSLASIVFFLFLLLKSPKISLAIDKETSKIAFSKMWPLAIAIMFNSIYLLGDRVILPLYVSQNEVGLYGASYRVLDIFLQIMALIMAIILPILSASWTQKNISEFKKQIQLSIDFLAILIFPMIFGVLILSDKIMVFVAGINFLESGKILFALTFAIFGIYLGQIGGHLMLSMDKQKKSLVVFILTSILAVIGYFIFIPIYGIWGAVAITIASEFFAGIILIILGLYYAKYFPKLTNIFKITFSSLIMSLFVFYLPSPHVLISIIYGIIVYSFLSITFNTIRLKTIKELFRNKL